MQTLWVAIIASVSGLIGVIVGGLLNYCISNSQFKRERAWQKNLLIKDKLEEIAKTVEKIEYRYRDWVCDAIKHIHFDEGMNHTGVPIPTERLTMLIDFYSPELNNYWESLNAELLSFQDLTIEAIEGKTLEAEKDVLVQKLIDRAGKIQKACKDLVNAAAEAARKRLA